MGPAAHRRYPSGNTGMVRFQPDPEMDFVYRNRDSTASSEPRLPSNSSDLPHS